LRCAYAEGGQEPPAPGRERGPPARDAAIKPAWACRCGGRTAGRLGATFVIAGTERDEYCVTVLDSEANEFDVQ